MQPMHGCIFHKYNMQKLDETSIALFKDSPSIGEIEIWYRSTQGVFCKSRAGYREILSVEKLTEYLQKLAER